MTLISILSLQKNLTQTCASTHMKSKAYDVKMNFLEIAYREVGSCETVVCGVFPMA